MKLLILPILSMFFLSVGCSSNKWDKKQQELQKQEAHNMIDQSQEVKIRKGIGDDKIILEDL